VALVRAKTVLKYAAKYVPMSRPFGSEPGTLPKQACQALPRIRPVHQAFRAIPIRDD
jgi:hypothetical protein